MNRAKGATIQLARFVTALFCAVVFAPNYARANSELDRQFSLESIGYLRAYDNMDGLFADYVSQAYRDYFSGQTRFVLQDLTQADAILSRSQIPFAQLIEDVDVLAQVARASRSETLLRTKIVKEGRLYRFTIDWIHAPKIDLIATETFTLEEPQDGRAVGLGDIQSALQGGLDRLIAKVPFQAMVTGRDNQSLTINLGAHLSLKKGDELVIGTLDEVKRHPLLKTIVEWKLTPVGHAIVEQVDDGIAFARVSDEEPTRRITRFQKVTQIIPYQEPKVVDGDSQRAEEAGLAESPPSLGWISAQILGGYHDRSVGTSSGTTTLRGSGFVAGARAEGEIWFTKDFFADATFQYGFGSLGQVDATTNTPTAGGAQTFSIFAYKFNAGFAFLTTGDFFGPKAWVKLGYRNTSYIYPANATEVTAPIAFGAFFAGLGGQLPIRAGFGIEANFEYGLFNSSGGFSGLSTGTVNGSNQAELYLGATYRYSPRITFRAGLSVLGTGADFSGGTSLGQKYLTFAPSIQYAF